MTHGLSNFSHQFPNSKLRIPALQPNSIVRTHLTDAWRQLSRHALTLISAPAGYGKTTLLSEWNASHADDGLSLAYVALDDDDNEPMRFATCLVAALARVNPSCVKPLWALLKSRRPLPLKDFCTALVNRLDTLDTPLALALDDYHAITSAAVHDGVSFCLDHLPATLHLIISTRRHPPLLLGQLRARGQLTEIRAADLAFNHQEAAAFLNQTTGLRLSIQDIATLHARTEGWPAGLQLVALSLQTQNAQQAHQRIQAISGSQRFIADYLVHQVLQRQSAAIKKFLVQTSILDQLSGALCEAVTGGAHGGRFLERIEQDNLFVAPLDEERQWYRYHVLWSDCLRDRLRKQSRAGEVQQLHARASQWYQQSGLAAQAIHHALAAADFERAAALIEPAAQAAMAHGEIETILAWLTALPAEQVRARPGLCVWYGWTLCLSGRLHEVEPLLRCAESTLEASLRREPAAIRCRSKLGEIAAVRALLARLQGDWARSITQSQAALAALQADDLIVRSVVNQNLGLVYIGAGEHETGNHALAEAERTSAAACHPYIYVRTLIYRARLCIRQGLLPEAIALFQRARERSISEGLDTLTRQAGVEMADVQRQAHGLIDPLSPRELEVLRLMSDGRLPREISVELGITVGTVRNHIKSIYSKLGAHSRVRAVEYARALRLV